MPTEQVCILGTGQMAVTCATLLAGNGNGVALLGLPSHVETMRIRRSAAFRLAASSLADTICTAATRVKA
jgi:hypothetical protein